MMLPWKLKEPDCKSRAEDEGEMNQLVPTNIPPLRRKLYDLFAAAPLIALYLFSLTQMLSPLALQISLAKLFIQTDPSVLPPVLVLGIVSKICTLVFFALLVVMFVVRRVPLHYPIAFFPRLAAGAGTFLGMGIVMLPTEQLSSGLYLISLLSIIGGTVFAVWGILALARSISIMPEARGLVTSGPYAFIRHPLYLGEFFVLVGIAVQHVMPWALLLLAVQCVCQFERMKNEERVLARAFPDYADYIARTARLLPGVY
ncbi:methyltransferase family protein [Bradyrhizobium canariense]|uniref:Protein-S-isoprenylcysteine O-methyltransferase Ste14 n=1 Tax=Bradyrhizobium canariense TaxID=255045 RepID=A0A1H1Y1I2_9BRAD|nr:isoprenylcysteine carboxylmethyltransferase family protein [Bradyrhizobium canariense]SDT15245.1 Protein-S-isoprenylcysteine O-methyltransferase Ste14 [Bradyrhizobium canariense]